jgi:hypothetical protein
MRTSNVTSSKFSHHLRLENRVLTNVFYSTVIMIFITLGLMGIHTPMNAQASIAAENVIDDIKVVTQYNEEKIYTVFQDAEIKKQYYYLPTGLRVADEKDVNGKVRPKMTILRYQYQDVKTKKNLEGGILVAAFTYAMEPEVVEDVKRQIRAKTGIKDVRLSAIPLNSSSIDFLADSDKFIGNKNAKTSFDGATSASQEIVLSLDLTVLGASAFKALAGSKGGIPIRANISYNGLTAACGYKVEGNWNNFYEYLEEKKLVEGGLDIWIFKAGGKKSKEKIKENLTNVKGMKVEIIECAGKSDSSSSGENVDDSNMYALITKIQNEVLSDSMMSRASEMKALQQMLVSANDKNTKKRILDMMTEGNQKIQVGYQQSLKSIKKRRKGSINYDFSRRRMVVRKSTIGGLLSFSKYGLDEEALLKEGYIIDIDVNGDFPSVIMGLPNVNPDFDLRALTLEVSYKNSEGKTTSEARQWTSESKVWETPMGEKVDYLRFNLIGEKDKSRINEPEFEMKLKVISNIPNASFTINKTVKLSRGEKYIDALELLTKQIIIDGSELDFAKLTDQSGDLAFAKLELKKGKLSINKSIKPFFINGQPAPPNPLYVLFPNDETRMTSRVVYQRKKGETRKMEDKELIELGENILLAPDWPGESEN